MSDATRRLFLQHTGVCVGAALAACAGLPVDLRALPIHVVESVAVGTERAFPIPAADSVNIDRRTSMILVRAQGKVSAFALSCPHERAAVKWVDRAGRFQCTKHDSKYTPDGTYVSGRATRNLDRFPIRKNLTDVLIDLDRVFRSDLDPAGWNAAVVTL